MTPVKLKTDVNRLVRVAAIEIGSRSVRLLIADVSAASGLKVISSDARETRLAAAVASGGDAIAAKMGEIATIVACFKKRSFDFRPDHTCIFATAAFRDMPEEHVYEFSKVIPELVVFDKKTEACCALISGTNDFQASLTGMETLVIDQGSGSMEMAVGEVSRNGISLKAYKSYKLGTQVLLNSLQKAGGDLHKFRSQLSSKIAELELTGRTVTTRPVLLGSAATKIAWVKVRRDFTEMYDPKRAHGQIITLESVDALIDIAAKSPSKAKMLVNPLHPDSGDFDIVITGLIGISIVLRRLDKTDFRVSAFGVRYGLVWMLGVYGSFDAIRG